MAGLVDYTWTRQQPPAAQLALRPSNASQRPRFVPDPVLTSGVFFMVLSLVVNAVALVVPYWVEGWDYTGFYGKGMWGACNCRWYLGDELQTFTSYVEPDGKVPIPTWFQAIQWVYVAAIVLMGIAAIWLISQFNCPCQRGKHKQHLAAGILLMLAFVLVSGCAITFGISAVQSDALRRPKLSGSPRLGWALWLSGVGALLCLAAGVIQIHLDINQTRKKPHHPEPLLPIPGPIPRDFRPDFRYGHSKRRPRRTDAYS